MKASRGFSLVTAIFLLVVVALLAGFLVNIGTTQHAGGALATTAARARFAAASGIEWGVRRVLAGGGGTCFGSPATFTLNGPGSPPFDLTVTCTATPVSEALTTYVVFDLEAVAEFGAQGSADYVSRRLAASVTSAP